MTQYPDGRAAPAAGCPTPAPRRSAAGGRAVAAHGTRARYVRGCHCLECREANNEYMRHRRRPLARPMAVAPQARVPTGQIRTHLSELRSTGLGVPEIAKRADITEQTVWRIISGEIARVSPNTKDRLMAVMATGVAPGAFVDHAVRTIEELDALLEMGWTRYQVAVTTGLPQTTVRDIRPPRAKITRRVAEAIHCLHANVFGGPTVDYDPRDPLAEWRLFLADIGDQSWREDAECRRLEGDARTRVDLFFPGRGADVTSAREVCDQCPVQAECLDFAVRTNTLVGIWGGTSGADRRALQHELRVDALAS